MTKKRTALTRSEVMSRIKGRDTKPEMRVRRALHAAGLRYRLQARELPGRPDIVFRPAKIAVFVHGCFWHRHADCEHARMPKSRTEFWETKLGGNVERDERNIRELEQAGWTVITAWECDTRDPSFLDDLAGRISSIAKEQKAGRKN